MSPRMRALRTFSSRGIEYRKGEIFKVKPRDAAALAAVLLAEPVRDDEEAEESKTERAPAGRSGAAQAAKSEASRAEAQSASKNLDAMTVAELKAFASKNNIALKSGLTKSEILSVVRRSFYRK